MHQCTTVSLIVFGSYRPWRRSQEHDSQLEQFSKFPMPSSGDSAALPDELFVDAADGEDDDMED